MHIRPIQATARLPTDQCWQSWQTTALAAVGAAPPTAADGSEAARAAAPPAKVCLVEWVRERPAVARSAIEIGRCGADHACVVVVLDGDGRPGSARGPADDVASGDAGLRDPGRPCRTSDPAPYRELRVLIPRAAFVARNGPIELPSDLKVSVRDPLCGLFTAYLAGYAAALPTLTPEEAECGLDGVLHLLSSLVARATDVDRDGAAMSLEGLRRLAERRIETQLGDPRLNASALARALGVSRTRLYEAFADRGGVAGAIRDARMERAGLMLAATDRASGSIEAIAARCGFTDYGTFARSFRRRFGAAPRDWRGQ